MRYWMMDHTADAGVIVIGETLAEVYRRAALALVDQIAEFEPAPDLTTTAEMTVHGGDRADLLVNWLREILFLFNGRRQLVADLSIHSVSRRRIAASVARVAWDPEKHRMKNEVKAVTYHRAAVQRTAGGWRAAFVLDV